MTFRQFDAMAKYIDNNQIIDQINHCRFFNPRRIPDSFDIEKIGRWLKNGWNTEFLLRQTPNYFADEDIVYALQWAFPQAYYSAFALTNAFFTSKSYTCESHASVIKHFSEHISGGKYPEPITYWADGGFNSMSTYRVNRMSGETSLAYNPSDINLVKHQIAQFLTSTRGINLKKRREDMKNDFRTLKGNKIKKALNSTEWGRVSNSLGKTSILSMLYRKRIKSNYHDIDSYLAIGLDAREIFHSLIKIVETLNLIHEACILKLIGETRIRNITDSASTNIEFASDRIDHLTSTIFSQ